MMDNGNIQRVSHKGHRERVRKKILSVGFDSFTDHEILEFYLYGIYKQKDTNALAHSLLNRFGCIRGVIDASIEELSSVPMVGKNGAVYIKGIAEISKRYFSDEYKKQRLDTVERVGEFFVHRFIGAGKESVCVLLLDKGMGYIDCQMIEEGTINSARFDRTKLYRLAFEQKAVYVIVAHNHPGGVAVPSEEDKLSTIAISNGLECLGIKLVEHFIIADGRYMPIMRNTQNAAARRISEEMLKEEDNIEYKPKKSKDFR